MVYVKWGFRLALLTAIVAFFHYYLPSRDIVRVVSTEVVRIDVETADAQGNTIIRNRDVRYIKAAWPDGAPRVYRNEDTGWGFPFYFKFDTANLATEADSIASTDADPKWVVITHYGWRITYWSMFPNAVSLRPADGPEEPLFPWFNVILLTGLVLLTLVLRRMVIILRQRHVDPVVEAIDEEIDQSVSWWRRQWRRIRG